MVVSVFDSKKVLNTQIIFILSEECSNSFVCLLDTPVRISRLVVSKHLDIIFLVHQTVFFDKFM